ELFAEDRPELGHELREHVGHHHGGPLEVRHLEGVALTDLDELADPGLLDVRTGLLDADGVDVDADAAGAVFLGGGDHDAAVAAAEVEDDVFPGDLGQFEHFVHHVLGGGDVDDLAGGGVLAAGAQVHDGAFTAAHGGDGHPLDGDRAVFPGGGEGVRGGAG